jgi:hypothetical protein
MVAGKDAPVGLSIRRFGLTDEDHVTTGVGQVSGRRRPQHAGTDHRHLAATLLRHRFSTIGPASPMGTSDANEGANLRGILPDVGQQVPDQEADGHRGR